MVIAVILLGLVSGCLTAAVEKRVACPTSASCHSNNQVLCASNGMTFYSMCSFEHYACQSNIYVIHYGSCRQSDRFTVYPTHHYYYYTSSQRPCEEHICNEELRPVCASDGNVYSNLCLFDRARCEAAVNGINLRIVEYANTCPEPTDVNCTAIYQHSADIAIEGMGSLSTTRLPPCSVDVHPVCGTDGVTYNGECGMCHYMMLHGATVQKLHDGVCRTYDETIGISDWNR